MKSYRNSFPLEGERYSSLRNAEVNREEKLKVEIFFQRYGVRRLDAAFHRVRKLASALLLEVGASCAALFQVAGRSPAQISINQPTIERPVENRTKQQNGRTIGIVEISAKHESKNVTGQRQAGNGKLHHSIGQKLWDASCRIAWFSRQIAEPYGEKYAYRQTEQERLKEHFISFGRCQLGVHGA
jgi:hypothetical protein